MKYGGCEYCICFLVSSLCSHSSNALQSTCWVPWASTPPRAPQDRAAGFPCQATPAPRAPPRLREEAGGAARSLCRGHRSGPRAGLPGLQAPYRFLWLGSGVQSPAGHCCWPRPPFAGAAFAEGQEIAAGAPSSPAAQSEAEQQRASPRTASGITAGNPRRSKKSFQFVCVAPDSCLVTSRYTPGAWFGLNFTDGPRRCLRLEEGRCWGSLGASGSASEHEHPPQIGAAVGLVGWQSTSVTPEGKLTHTPYTH